MFSSAPRYRYHFREALSVGFCGLLKNTSPEAAFVPLRGREAISPLFFGRVMLDCAIIGVIDSLCLMMVLNRQMKNVDGAERGRQCPSSPVHSSLPLFC